MKVVPILELPVEQQARVRQLRNQPDVRKFMYTDHEISEAEHLNWLEALRSSSRQQVFVVVLEAAPVGVVSLSAINRTHGTAEWAFYLDTTLQGKGLGSQVELWLLDYAFGAAGLEKLNCEVLEINPAVIKMHQKFGFVVEGVRREHIVRDGKRIGAVLLGITKREWQAQRPRVLAAVERIAGRR
ncbi:UDP-4-amino-4,6-dideoxy-N-acetyl-beta-L-altrosamine N-acetyltransferase [Pseudomonas sp. W2Oct36]|jgi:UDP-4-amino-4,6-dideoxy-N-acetyl-beta-L-altrosamine N-acetyltransferase|uniref:UDP-4-amino-4, 6-dideoxy-N-acetyl-beta-L-altrosamine N-acetyltransferase n=1 Tax=unclassified Pseudomonas TaxID=196821 RepID=UPI0011F7F742|nr:UDP-4-amino-4,6-dideoxy-N-acetyl-beta-L-altrosamine N-acetyltransferase [Pseudomonas sp.]RZI70607.1 MAG: UDP-4-amino-4,6-dideoxy-N-acetyl-beta-L-altrosamine N-acetyltransferase [Pseudomonas sp.]